MPETVPCNLCGSNVSKDEPRKAMFLNMAPPLSISHCQPCGFRYQNPRPTLAELKSMYETHPYYSLANANRGESRREFYEARFSRVEKFTGLPGDMLAMGCLEGGHALLCAQSRGWQVQGVEFSEILAGHARNQLGLNVAVADSWNLDALAGRQYDLIYSHSLEHVPDARYSIATSRSLLRPDGLLLLEVPNQFRSLKDILKRIITRLAPGSKKLFYQDVVAEFHTYFFTPKTLRELLTSEGFEILSLTTYLPNHPVYLSNATGRRTQEAIYAIGGLLERGPCIEVVARLNKDSAMAAPH